MILAALAFAGILDAATAVPTVAARPSISPRVAEKTPNLYREPAGCRTAPYRVVDRFGRPLPKKLGDLPPGGVILAVERTIGGCQVVTVAFSGGARDRLLPPAWAYRIEPDRFAPKREDAPSNRR